MACDRAAGGICGVRVEGGRWWQGEGKLCPTQSRDRTRVAFVCHWVAHTRREGMGDCTYTVDTLYEHDIKISELSEAQVELQMLET